MYLGYQNDLIAFVAETEEELENMALVEFSRIVQTDEKYILSNGKYITETEAIINEKDIKNTENIVKAKSAILNGSITFNDAQIETDSQTVSDLIAAMLILQRQKEYLSDTKSESIEMPEITYSWLSKDDKIVELTIDDFIEIGSLIAKYKSYIWNDKYILYKNSIKNATTMEELNKIEIIY